jgi:hypothetical protein
VRFPPDRKVENLVIGRASVFDLNRPGVVGSLSVWNGEVEPIGNLIDVWVQIQGIPPKWVDWKTLWEVSSSLGRMIEVDWQELFNSFFSTVRVKIQCKDPTRIPRERIFVFKSNVHLIVFTPEGYEQAEVSDGGSDKGGGEEKKGEDTLEDDLSASGKGGSNSPKEKSKEKEKDQSSNLPQGNKSGTASNQGVRRLLQFDEASFDNQAQTFECANLLKAMELDEEEGLVEELEDNFDTLIQEDDETCQLPEEWVFNITEDIVGSQANN